MYDYVVATFIKHLDNQKLMPVKTPVKKIIKKITKPSKKPKAKKKKA